MAIMTKAFQSNNEYLKLIKRYPLRPIKNGKMLEAASEFYSELVLKGEKRTTDENDYLAVLGKLIREYEDAHLAPLAKSMTPQRALASLMEDNQLTQSGLAEAIGIPQSVISEFLSGKRHLSKSSIVKVARYFAVSPVLFLPIA